MPRLLWLLPAAIILWNLGYAPLWNPDEGRYAAAAYEMAHPFDGARPDWLVPHLNTVPRLNKPPLVYWGIAGAYGLFGVGAGSARAVSALAALIVLGLLYLWGARVWNARAGWAAGLAWASAVFVAAMGRIANTDMLLCSAIALALFGVFWAIESEAGGGRRLEAGALAGVGLAAALLSKGPIGVALPVLIALVYLSLTRSWKRAPWGAMGLALLVGIGLGAPWFLAVEARQPGFLRTFIFAENLGRFSGQEGFHKKTSPFYYLPVVVLGFMPWTGFLLPMLAGWREGTTLAGRARIFAALWALIIVGFFSVSQTKLISYALPAFPALALLVGGTLGRWESVAIGWRRAALGATLGFVAVLLGALWALPHRDKISGNFYLTPGVLLDDVIVPRAVGAPWTWALTWVLLAFCAGLIWIWRAPNARATLAVMGAGGAALVMAMTGVAGAIAAYEDATQMFANLRPELRPGDRVASYRAFVPSLIPYAGRPLWFFTFSNSSGLSAQDLAQSRYFSTARDDVAFKAWLQKPGRAFVVTEGLRDAELARSLFLWGRTNDFFLLCNEPRPAGFAAQLTFASPKRGLKNRLIVPENSNR